MPFVPVPKDLTKVKTKVALNLTKRQIICFSLGALVGVPVYIFTRGAIGNESAVLLMIGLMLPFFFFAMYEKDGQPLEKVLKHFVSTTFLSPQTRPYQTDNTYAALERQNEYDKEVEKFENKAANQAGKNPAKCATSAQAGEGGVKGDSAFSR